MMGVVRIMGPRDVDDRRENIFFSHETTISNTSNNTSALNSFGATPSFRSIEGSSCAPPPFRWEREHGKRVLQVCSDSWKPERPHGFDTCNQASLPAPPESRPTSGSLLLCDNLSRLSISADGLKFMRKRVGKAPDSEALEKRNFGYYNYEEHHDDDLRYENESIIISSPGSSTLDHNVAPETSIASDGSSDHITFPEDDDDDDSHRASVHPAATMHETQQQQQPVTHERWSSNGNSWNLSIVARKKPRDVSPPQLTKLSKTRPKPPPPLTSSRGMCAAAAPIAAAREAHRAATGSMMKEVFAYTRSGDRMYGRRHRWERESSGGSIASVGKLEFEAYDRAEEEEEEEVVDTVDDEEDFPFSPIASSFVFGDNNSSVEFSQVRRGRLPKEVGPLIMHEFSIPPQFGMRDGSRANSTSTTTSSNDCMTPSSLLAPYSWEPGGGGDQEPKEQQRQKKEQQQRIPTKAFPHQYIINNGSGRFRIELQRGPKLEQQRHRNSSRLQNNNNNKTPEVLIRLVEEAATNMMMSEQQRQQQQKTMSRSKNSCTQCRCLPVLRKGFLGRCLSLNQRPGCAVVNSFEARLGTVDEKVVMREAPNFEVMREVPNFNMREVPNFKGETSNFKVRWEGPNSEVRGEGHNFKMSFTSSEITRDAQNFIYR
ncbi:unnamed protein product [Sphagnum troendelagicum]